MFASFTSLEKTDKLIVAPGEEVTNVGRVFAVLRV